ncbi:fibronectin type III domain-containing protein [Blastococcus sp. SYSU DS0973]
MSIPIAAPPATVTVKDAAGTTAVLPVTVLGGAAPPGGSSGGGTAPDAGTPPGQPTGVVATVEDGQTTVTWVAPTDLGDTPLIRYLVTAVDPAGTVFRATAAPDATSAVVTDLLNGERYTVRVRAVNEAGAGMPSTPVWVVPAAP